MLDQYVQYINTPHSQQLIKFIDSTYERYKETPKWHYLQTLFKLVLELGIEIGKNEITHNLQSKDE